MVLEPTTSVPDAASLMGVPATVIPGPPGVRVVPAMGMDVGLAVKVWPPTAYI